MSWFVPSILSGQSPPPRASHSSVTLNSDKIVMWGGDDGKGALFKDGYIFDIGMFLIYSMTIKKFVLMNIIIIIEKVKWSQLKFSGSKPTARILHTLVTDGDYNIYLNGGYDGKKPLQHTFKLDLSMFLLLFEYH